MRRKNDFPSPFRDGQWRSYSVIGPDCHEQFLPLDHPQAQPLRERGIILGGVSDLVTPYDICRVPSGIHVILFTLNGKIIWQTPDNQGNLVPGKMYLFPAGMIYRYFVPPRRRWRIIWFHIDAQHLPFGPGSFICEDEPQLARLQELVKGFLEETIQHPGNQLDESAALYAQLIGLFLWRRLSGILPRKYFYFVEQIRILREALLKDLAAEWTVPRMAKILHVSETTLTRILRNTLHTTPSRFLWRLRLERAKGLLASSDMTIDRIAQYCGFQCGFSLSRAFKREYQESPQHYRRRLLLHGSAHPNG